LALFKLGYSWGGTTSLVMPFFDLRRSGERQPGTIVRFSIGLEAPEDRGPQPSLRLPMSCDWAARPRNCAILTELVSRL